MQSLSTRETSFMRGGRYTSSIGISVGAVLMYLVMVLSNGKDCKATLGSPEHRVSKEKDLDSGARADAFRCFDKLFQTTKEQFEENASLTIPVLNSARYTKTGDEIQLFFVFGRHTNMKDELHLQFKNGDYFCDDYNTKARVLRHSTKGINQMKMYCPQNTTTVFFETKEAWLKPKVTFDLKPFLECDKLHQALMPFDTKDQKIAACTQVKYAESYHSLPEWVEYHRMLGIDTFWIYINDKMTTYEMEAPAVVSYFNRPDVQEYASVLPAEWTEHVEPFFTRKCYVVCVLEFYNPMASHVYIISPCRTSYLQ